MVEHDAVVTHVQVIHPQRYITTQLQLDYILNHIKQYMKSRNVINSMLLEMLEKSGTAGEKRILFCIFV